MSIASSRISPDGPSDVVSNFNTLQLTKNSKCETCNTTVGLKLCGSCKLVPYCSVKCQKQNREEHKQFCKKVSSKNIIMQDIVNKNNINILELLDSLPDFVEEKINAISLEERETKAYVYNKITNDGYYIEAKHKIWYVVSKTTLEVIKRARKCKRILILDYPSVMLENNPMSILVCTCKECIEKSTNK